MATTSRLLCCIAVLLALAACDQGVPTDPLAPGGPRRALDFDTAQLSREGYEMVTLFDVPVKLKDASVPWTSTGVTLAAGEYAYLIPEGSVSFTLNDIGWANCAVVFYWYCEKKGGSAGPYGGVGGPSGGHDGHLRLFYRVNGAGTPSQILASAAVAKGPGTIEVSRTGSDGYWDFSGKQTVQIWRMRGAQPPPCTPGAAAAVTATCQQEPRIKLACTPNPVTRGEVIRCTASKDSASPPGELKITGWSFKDVEREDGEVTSTEWKGVVVQGGTVQVRGTIDDRTVSPASTTIRVKRREWPVMQFAEPPKVAITVDPLNMSPYPPDANAYGRFILVSDEFTAYFGAIPVSVINSGPNAGRSFLPDSVRLMRPRVHLHPALYDAGVAGIFGARGYFPWNHWYDDQNGRGSGTCRERDIAAFRALVERHEGVTMQENSHYGKANEAFRQAKLQEQFEELSVAGDEAALRFEATQIWNRFEFGIHNRIQGQFDARDTPLVFEALGCALDSNKHDR
jgi:hypothetical protein